MRDIRQHSAVQSVLLHLLPGVSVLVAILIFSIPDVSKALGVDERLSPILGYLLGLLFGLFPVQLGILLLAGKSETGKPTIRGIIAYTEKSPARDYGMYVPALLVYFMVMFIVIAPIIQPFIISTFFSWWPEMLNFQLLLQNPAQLAGFSEIGALLVVYLLVSCLMGPFVEELYFRGYLLPRMAGYAGRWAPLLNTVLFSVYHFFSPWENLIRIAASYPLVYLVWKKRNIRFGMLVHILINTIGGIGALAMIASK